MLDVLQKAGVARPVHPCTDRSLSVAALRVGVILGCWLQPRARPGDRPSCEPLAAKGHLAVSLGPAGESGQRPTAFPALLLWLRGRGHQKGRQS